MATAKLVIGVKSIKSGPVPDDGTMGTVLALLGDGKTYKDSASFKSDKPTVFDVLTEETDDPEASFATKGKKVLAFSLIDHSPETLLSVLGGEITDGVWGAPDTVPVIEQSLQVITQTGMLYEIPRGRVIGNQNDELKKGAVGLIDVEVTVLKPAGAGVKSYNLVPYELPVVSAGAAQNITIATADLVGTATAFRGEIVSQIWTCTTKPVGAAAPGITTPATLNTGLTGLVDGVYKFTLSVKDENDFENSATVLVTVALA